MRKQHKARNETGLVLFCRRNVHERTTTRTNELQRRAHPKDKDAEHPTSKFQDLTDKKQSCSWAVPGGLWGHESGHVYGAPNIIFKPYRALPPYSRTEPQCKLPCQTAPRILV